MTEKEKMLEGEYYNPLDKELVSARIEARLLQQKLNNCSADNGKELKRLSKLLIPNQGKSCFIQPPFYCDYGTNIHLGKRVFFNFNCVVLDVTPVKIGDRTMFGPHVQIYTASHPLEASPRASGAEFGKPITIGEDVWIGGNVTICPGITIGNRSVIGAGSVVTKDIPEDVFAAGNPCKMIKPIDN
ncbi:sugar O-acetyltransferase [Croceitalea rosinachiae]|uniref:Acetyltransferase n=1 Tax=Croceitalea rosinachiae TaxID=3075596 RepID=A0ABU3AAA5_9FLAO|nr:sugar O-acetyltransferase [Croceitalea sp. F388]MDT0607116.1 sugar O-acetyltransferase [Croceitalea sp. F388]